MLILSKTISVLLLSVLAFIFQWSGFFRIGEVAPNFILVVFVLILTLVSNFYFAVSALVFLGLVFLGGSFWLVEILLLIFIVFAVFFLIDRFLPAPLIFNFVLILAISTAMRLFFVHSFFNLILLEIVYNVFVGLILYLLFFNYARFKLRRNTAGSGRA